MGRKSYQLFCASIGLCVLTAGALIWFRMTQPLQRHSEFYHRVRADLETLAKKRPPNVTRKQWEQIVGWTLNAHGNCLASQQNMPPEEMNRFEAELTQRLQGTVDLGTIDWIWDEIVRLTSSGRTYSDRWRPTSPEKLKEFEEGNHSWGIDVD
jgi:hypothetical protein